MLQSASLLGQAALGERAGDAPRARCTYDNTLANPGVARALSDAGLAEPADVYMGETTLDEMCLGVFGIVYE